jgi:hypothetical protein
MKLMKSTIALALAGIAVFSLLALAFWFMTKASANLGYSALKQTHAGFHNLLTQNIGKH